MDRGSGVPAEIGRPVRLGIFALALCTLAVITIGCGKDKVVAPPRPVPFTYPALTTPESTVINVKYACERRDSTRTKQIYADNYVGTSTDQTDHTTLTFTKDQEVAVVGVMARRTEISQVAMDLKPATWLRTHYLTDPAGVAAIQMTGVNIQVDDTQFGTQVANVSTFFEFKLKPTVDHTSPTDTTWQVVGWTEIKQ